MNNEGIFMVANTRLVDRLPSLPQVLVKLLDTLHGDQANIQQITDMVRKDAAMSARLMGFARSGLYARTTHCPTLEQALMLLGMETVKTVVITTIIEQFFSRFNLRHQTLLKTFWKRSLISAQFAQVLAKLTGYPQPDIAYLSGLLMDVGQILLLSQHDQRYANIWQASTTDQALLEAERQLLNTDHCAQGADLLDHWQLWPFMGDALRYHHEPGDRIYDAHHLVKIVNLSSRMSFPGRLDEQSLHQAYLLFALNDELTRELRQRIHNDVDKFATSLSIEIGDPATTDDTTAAEIQLQERLAELGKLTHITLELWRTQSIAALEHAIHRALFMTMGIESSILFSLAPTLGQLHAYITQPQIDPTRQDQASPPPDFSISLQAGRSLVADCLLQAQPLTNTGEVSLVDRQLLSHFKTERLLCLPLIDRDVPVGVLVIGINPSADNQFLGKTSLLKSLAQEIATNLGQQLSTISSSESSTAKLSQEIREMVHEASNPLTIIRNYLSTLRIKLAETNQNLDELPLIQQEIDRVGNILLHFPDPQASASIKQSGDINQLINELTTIIDQSLCSARQVTIKRQLTDPLPPFHGGVVELKQVLTNLLKNAVEALPPGGLVTLSTTANVVVNGRKFSEINICDDGPGIPDSVLSQLFSPVTSTKGGGHSGLGLSITKKLVDQIGGHLVCKTGSTGTQFQLLIPA